MCWSCQENAAHNALLSRDQDTFRQVQDPNKSLNQTLSASHPIHNHQISSTIYSVSLYLKDSCQKTYKNNTHHTKTHHKATIKNHQNPFKRLLSKLGTETGWNVRPWHRRKPLQGHHQWLQPGPPAVPKYSAKTSSPAAFGPATNGICGFGKWLMVDLGSGPWWALNTHGWPWMMILKNGWQKKTNT